ncbi:hypothetical protein ACB092_10G106900 [Castanea dentata]
MQTACKSALLCICTLHQILRLPLSPKMASEEASVNVCIDVRNYSSILGVKLTC